MVELVDQPDGNCDDTTNVNDRSRSTTKRVPKHIQFPDCDDVNYIQNPKEMKADKSSRRRARSEGRDLTPRYENDTDVEECPLVEEMSSRKTNERYPFRNISDSFVTNSGKSRDATCENYPITKPFSVVSSKSPTQSNVKTPITSHGKATSKFEKNYSFKPLTTEDNRCTTVTTSATRPVSSLTGGTYRSLKTITKPPISERHENENLQCLYCNKPSEYEACNNCISNLDNMNPPVSNEETRIMGLPADYTESRDETEETKRKYRCIVCNNVNCDSGICDNCRRTTKNCRISPSTTTATLTPGIISSAGRSPIVARTRPTIPETINTCAPPTKSHKERERRENENLQCMYCNKPSEYQACNDCISNMDKMNPPVSNEETRIMGLPAVFTESRDETEQTETEMRCILCNKVGNSAICDNCDKTVDNRPISQSTTMATFTQGMTAGAGRSPIVTRTRPNISETINTCATPTTTTFTPATTNALARYIPPTVISGPSKEPHTPKKCKKCFKQSKDSYCNECKSAAAAASDPPTCRPTTTSTYTPVISSVQTPSTHSSPNKCAVCFKQSRDLVCNQCKSNLEITTPTCKQTTTTSSYTPVISSVQTPSTHSSPNKCAVCFKQSRDLVCNQCKSNLEITTPTCKPTTTTSTYTPVISNVQTPSTHSSPKKCKSCMQPSRDSYCDECKSATASNLPICRPTTTSTYTPPTSSLSRMSPHATRKKSSSHDKRTRNNCVICLDDIELGKEKMLSKCKHVFCKDCIDSHFKVTPKCPTCNTIYGTIIGTQPPGVMAIRIVDKSLPGYEGIGTIVIEYKFNNGVQGEDHPNPGRTYEGTKRTAYLPNTDEGMHCAELLFRAFETKNIFRIGNSLSTGRGNVIIWNDIHHKTSTIAGAQYGYPDNRYLQKLRDELKTFGIE